jgi:hypothetical protein
VTRLERDKLLLVRIWIAPLTLSALALSCTLTNDLSELEGSSDGGTAGGAGGAAGSGGSGANPSLCQAACDRELTANCPNGDPTSCIAACQSAPGALSDTCKTAWYSLLTCASQQGTYACDANGDAKLTNCTAQSAELSSCLSSGSGGSGGSGTGGSGGSGTGGSGGSGTGGSGGTSQCNNPYASATCNDFQQNVCTDCIIANCCQPANDCFANAECGGLYACYAECQTAPDPLACVNQQCPECQGGMTLLTAFAQCTENYCSTECSGTF